MNRDWILLHLKEASEELTRTIQEIEKEPEYEFGEYLIAMMHVYNHLNTAWNSRDETRERVESCSLEEFNQWRQFPVDIDMKAT
jgi:hypothetical protein